MNPIIEMHCAHLERLARLNVRSPLAGPLKIKPQPRIVWAPGRKPAEPAKGIAMMAIPPAPPEPAPLAIPGRITVAQVLATVAAHRGVSVADLQSACRMAKLVRVRQIAMYLCITVARASSPQTAARLGGRDHTTVLHGRDKIAGLIETDPTTAAIVGAIKQQLEASLC